MNILLIEDDPIARDLLADELNKGEWELETAKDGLEGWDKLSCTNYHLILLDIKLPKLNGFEVLKKLRFQNSDTPVIITSANQDIDTKLRSFELGADDFLAKPFHLKELKARINYQTQPKTKSYSNINKSWQVANFSLNNLTREIFYKDTPIEVTTTEFQIFTIMAENYGQIVSRESLSEQVLNKPLCPYDRSIDVHISNLRKKLQQQSGVNCFKTVRGKGYALIASPTQ